MNKDSPRTEIIIDTWGEFVLFVDMNKGGLEKWET